jgi:predicted GNAT family N-acyltransferase
LKIKYRANNVTTTYTYGNNHAKHIYESIGFIETDTVEEDGIHEVNMIIEI